MNVLSRRLFLRNVPPVLVAGTTIAAPAVVAKPMTPDERIDAAVEEIKAAFLEKWPDAILRVDDVDNGEFGMVVVLSHCGTQPHHCKHGRGRGVL